jgi:hypothetical protein
MIRPVAKRGRKSQGSVSSTAWITVLAGVAAFTAPACEGRSAEAISATLEAAIPTSSDSVPQPRIAHEIVRLPVVEGQRLRFRQISTADGLSQTRVAHIVQDDRGFIWFGTQYGLNRYDGYEFKLFVHDPRRTNSLSGTFIAALFKDRSGADGFAA